MPAYLTLKGQAYTGEEPSLPSVNKPKPAKPQNSAETLSSKVFDERRLLADGLLPSNPRPDYHLTFVGLWRKVQTEYPLIYDGAISSDVDSFSSLIQIADWFADLFSTRLACLQEGGRRGSKAQLPSKLPEFARLNAWILNKARDQAHKDLGIVKPRRAEQTTDKKKKMRVRPKDEMLRIKLSMYTAALTLVHTWKNLLQKRKDSLVSEVVHVNESSHMNPSTVPANSELFKWLEQQAAIVYQPHSPFSTSTTATPPSPALAISPDPAGTTPASTVLPASITKATDSLSAEVSLPQTQGDYGDFDSLTDFMDSLVYWGSFDSTQPLATLLSAPNRTSTYSPSSETPALVDQDHSPPSSPATATPPSPAPVPSPSLATQAEIFLPQIKDEPVDFDFFRDLLNRDSFGSTQPLAALLPAPITTPTYSPSAGTPALVDQDHAPSSSPVTTTAAPPSPAPAPSPSLAHSLDPASTAPASPLPSASITMAIYSPSADIPPPQIKDGPGDFDSFIDFLDPFSSLNSFQSMKPLATLLPASIPMATYSPSAGTSALVDQDHAPSSSRATATATPPSPAPVPSPSLALSPEQAWAAPASPLIPAPSDEMSLPQLQDEHGDYDTFTDSMNPLAYWDSFISTHSLAPIHPPVDPACISKENSLMYALGPL